MIAAVIVRISIMIVYFADSIPDTTLDALTFIRKVVVPASVYMYSLLLPKLRSTRLFTRNQNPFWFQQLY